MSNVVLRTASIVLALSPLAKSQVTTAYDTNASCIEKLQMPIYPPLARQARLSGTLTVSVALGSNASVQSISSEMAPQSRKAIFVYAVERSIRASSFTESCGGKTVKLVFQFVLDDGSPSDRVQDVSFGFPNRFWISIPPGVLNP